MKIITPWCQCVCEMQWCVSATVVSVKLKLAEGWMDSFKKLGCKLTVRLILFWTS